MAADTDNNDDSSSCPCSLFPLPRIAKLVVPSPSEQTIATDEHFQRLVRWIRGKNLPCVKKSGLCRLETAREILQAIRDSLPTVEEPTTTAGTKNATLTLQQQDTSRRITPKLMVNDVHSFPPLAPASGSGSTPSSQKQQADAAFPVLGAPSPTKKGKRRIRPAMISTSPLMTMTTTADSSNTVWGSESRIASWPGAQSSTNHSTSSNLLEHRLSSTNTPVNEPAPSPTPTKTKPTVALSPVPTPTKKICDNDSNECIREALQKPPPPSLVRLVDLHTAIMEALLIQSTPNEVQYVLRLFHGATAQNNLVLKSPQRPIFELSAVDDVDDGDGNHSRRRIICVHYASLLLNKWSDRLIRWGFSSHLTECPSIQQYCPGLYQKSQDYRTQHAEQRHSHPRTTVFWTLPFNEMRDSRNRYRTPDELALYKNREETRDSFLSHLRSFYNQGSSVQIATSKSADQVRKAARSVLGTLWDDNMPWMAEFFTDMLLQLGSVPVQETDREVLKMADQEKVQKLHQRFKAPAPRKGNNNSNGGRNKKASPVLHEASPITAVQEEFFRGHQEFFFYFVMLADSHKLNHHLRHQFLTKIYRESSSLSSSNIDRSLEDLCLLAKFLGLLIFSPNWHSSKYSLDESRSRSLVYDELDFLKFGGKGVCQVLQDAWKVCRLVSVIPWLVEMFRLSVWDETFRRTHSFREVSRLLRLIQLKTVTESHRVSQDCKEVLLLCLESFVDEIAGLDWIEALKLDFAEIESSEGRQEKNGLDTETNSFERGTIFSVNNRSENVLNVVTDLTRSSRGLMRSPGVSRKVRPSMVLTEEKEKKPKPQTPEPEIDIETKVQMELRASFFHLHRDLQVICEFVVDRVVNNLSELLKSVQVEESLVILPDESLDKAATRQILKMKCTDCLRFEFERCLEKSLALYAPTTDKNVRRIANAVSVDQGMQTVRPKLDTALSEMISAATANLQRLQKKKLFSKDAGTSASKLSGIVLDLEVVREKMEKYPDEPNDLLESMQKARSSLDMWIAMEIRENSPEEDLRSFYVVIDELDSSCSSFLQCLLNSSIIEKYSWWLLIELLRIAARSSHMCSYGFQSVKFALADIKTVSWLISGGEEPCGGIGSMKQLIQELCQARLIPVRFESEAMLLAGDS
eukprot:scaffold353_cov185-Amphora_coffeaeformis.AAC.71